PANSMGLSLLTTLFFAAGCPSPCESRHGPPEDAAPVPAGEATEPRIRVTVPWLVAQLVPNPALALGASGAHLRLSWQLSPVLYSLFMDPRLSPWRFFIAEPIVRHAGSIELLLSPEYVSARGQLGQRWGYRALVRSTLGLIQRGDYLSMSLGTGYLSLHEGQSVEYEAGIYAL